MPLDEYRAKRDFTLTPEPAGGTPSPDALRFVVQQHHASRMHWDFRLELDGVLMSWAVPKGPSMDPAEKRLAMHVEDHPLDYAGFEGVIPAGEYGGGKVIVWDAGTWEPVGDPHAGMAKGDFKFTLAGEKLIGRWVLVRLKLRGNERGESWLLIKERDEHARAHAEFDVTAMRPESILSGRLVDDVDGPPDAAAAPPTPTPTPTPTPAAAPAAPEAPLALPPELALCTLVTAPPAGDGWLAEVKYDGYRLTIAIEEGHARCFSRNGADVTERFSALAVAASRLPAATALIDGEAVVFDERGATDFGALQSALTSAPDTVALAAFDLTYLNGHDIRPLPTSTRKELLQTLLAEQDESSRLRFAHYVEGDAAAFFEVACAQGLEGAVFKRADAPYPKGRTRTWLKVKCRKSQEFVVGGYTEPAGNRQGFGALLLGTYDDSGALVYAGRAGSGFSDREIAELTPRLAELEQADPPFAAPPEHLGGRTARWVKPSLVAAVAFTEWTSEGLLRQPSFLGLRDDLEPASVRREVPVLPDLETPPAPDPEPSPAPTAAADPAVVLDVRISNPDKQLFPETELGKLGLARYYEAIAPIMLPEVATRPLTLVRCPIGDGSGTCFYQRHPERGLSARISRLEHALAGHEEADEWLTVSTADGLVALAQMGVAEIHTWLSRSDAPGRPDRIIFDLDPGPDVTWPAIAEAARQLRDETAELGFTPFVKSTGSKGLHVVLPIEPVWEFERIRALAKGIAERLAARHSGTLTARMAKNQRGGRIFIDYVRNSEGASAVAPYSTRHLPGPPVAVPLSWGELDDASLDIRSFTPERVLERIRAGVDPWRDLEDSSAGTKVLRSAEGSLDV